MHRDARLTPAGRLLLCERIQAGWPVSHAASSMGISRDRAYVWWRRYQAEGVADLEDRSSRPRRTPTRTKASRERRIVRLRRSRGLGPARIAGIVGLPASPSIPFWPATGSTDSITSTGSPAPRSGGWRWTDPAS